MCGRATLTTAASEIAEAFGIAAIPVGPPRYNVAPGQTVVVVRPGRELDEMALVRWGLLPWWSKADKAHKPLVQARAETLATAPAFRDAFRARRCLMVVDGFYEWRDTGSGRIPHHVRRKDGGLLAIAGVWDRSKAKDGALVETCAVVTTEARGALRELHDRMPLVLEGEDRERWLHAPAESASALMEHVAGADARAAELVAIPVSTWVNDVRHEGPRCLEPIAYFDQQPKLF